MFYNFLAVSSEVLPAFPILQGFMLYFLNVDGHVLILLHFIVVRLYIALSRIQMVNNIKRLSSFIGVFRE